ncbi:unnamed protein product [Polarella glacialis]|uniref:Uncharacterized protein n=1 Tax=Polarella glacialis TaxID=89957 RepID=A0A813E1N4_POLGL|nr:unnamed protein product [Polarella glacialis]CAE8718394.1 unnamed protein product [Polarella glacialis]
MPGQAPLEGKLLGPPTRGLGDDALLDPSEAVNGRYVHLDVTRICCIMCVVLSSFDERYALMNTGFAWQWVLQILWLLCGICFGLSDRSYADYAGRLMKYLGVGLLVNWSAWVLNGWTWQTDVWGVPVQMMFVLNLIVVTALLAPIKSFWVRPLLEEERRLPVASPTEDPISAADSSRDKMLRAWLILGSGLIGIVLCSHLFLRPALIELIQAMHSRAEYFQIKEMMDPHQSSTFAVELVCQLQVCAAALWILVVSPLLFDKSLTAWMLFANFYLHRAFLGLWRTDLFSNSFCLVMIAMVACRFGLAKRRQLGKLVHRYWFFIMWLAGMLWSPGFPGTDGAMPVKRYGLVPQTEADQLRMVKHFATEALLTMAWLTGGQHMVDKKIFTVDGLSWVNEWAVVAFLMHTGLRLLLGSPLGWVALLAIGPVCWASSRSSRSFEV